jgi:putative holliday junction resolvase
MNDEFTIKGRVMALDLGEKRIGVAVSDELRLVAKSYVVVKRQSRREDFARYQTIITEQKITLLVIGLPITLGGEDSQKTAWVRDYADDLRAHITIPITFWDESLTTIEAEASLRERGIRGKKAKNRVDAVAAAFILQNYLDAQSRHKPAPLILAMADLAYSGYEPTLDLFRLILEKWSIEAEIQVVPPLEILEQSRQRQPALILTGNRNLTPEVAKRFEEANISSIADIIKPLKDDPQTRHIPVILVEAITNIGSVAQISGADDYLSLPCSPEEFINKVKPYLDNV